MNTPIQQLDQRQQSAAIGYVMQDPENQIVTDKVWHELAFGLESLGYNKQTIRLRVAEIANFFNIADWFHKKTNQLSGGQKQLLNLASIMAMQPKVLILDEPTSQLDPIAAVEFLETLKKINRELAVTIVLSEHRLEEVFSYSDRVILIDDGKIVYDDQPQRIGDFMQHTKHPLAVAMPTPVQLYSAFAQTGDCPITIKQGRQWLDGYMSTNDIVSTLQQSNQFYEQQSGHKPFNLRQLLPVIQPNPTAAVVLKDIWFRYQRDGADILRDLSLTVDKMTFHAIIGGNGAGKSTLLNIIAATVTAYRGKIVLNNRPLKAYDKSELHGKTVALLPQNPQTLFVAKNLYLDLASVLSKRNVTQQIRQQRIEEVLALTELSDLTARHPYDLSGGEQQRAALAKILLLDPDIILLDEPTKGLDGFYKIKLAQVLKRLISAGKTLIMVSHDIEFCAKYADSCSLLFDGQLISSAKTRPFFSGNAFYTTAANRLSRHVFKDCIQVADIKSQLMAAHKRQVGRGDEE